jgi:hypothetical protein
MPVVWIGSMMGVVWRGAPLLHSHAARGNENNDIKETQMSLLREIQTAAIESNADLSTLLRKCKVLAARLGSQEFGMWVENELSGYKSIDDLPEYRVFHVNSKGHFSGAFGSGINYADIPLICIPEKYREMMSKSNMMQSVAYIENLVSKSNSGLVQEPWDPDFVVIVGRKIYQNMNCMAAWKDIPIGCLVHVLNEVRNRILDFVLKIEAENPEAGEAALNSNPVPPEKVQQIFNTTINGNVGNVATGSHSFEQNANSEASTELFDKILEALKQVQGPESNKAAEIIEKMRVSQNADDLKDNYQNLMSFLSNHITVFGAISPYIPALTQLITR